MKRFLTLLVLVVLLHGVVSPAFAVFRFPMPDFESGYQQPQEYLPMPKTAAALVDTAVLLGALSLCSVLVLKRRSRREIFMLTVFCVLYFGFFRKGCICPVGSLQNVLDATMHEAAVVPVVVVVFFLLPLLFALFFGRVFCSSVCPLGAIQDLVVVRPLRVPGPLGHALGMLPYLYLGLVILFAATGAGYMICRFDPFVSFFRLSGSAGILYAGAGFLIAGTVRRVVSWLPMRLCLFRMLSSWLLKME